MAIKQICPICGSPMFHDKGNHIMFCGQCDHVGWPHDATVSEEQQRLTSEESTKNRNPQPTDEKKPA